MRDSFLNRMYFTFVKKSFVYFWIDKHVDDYFTKSQAFVLNFYIEYLRVCVFHFSSLRLVSSFCIFCFFSARPLSAIFGLWGRSWVDLGLFRQFALFGGLIDVGLRASGARLGVRPAPRAAFRPLALLLALRPIEKIAGNISKAETTMAF